MKKQPHPKVRLNIVYKCFSRYSLYEYHKKAKRNKAERKKALLERPNVSNDKSSKKKIPLIVKILIWVFSIPIVFILIVFLVFFIKGFIQGIS